MCTDSRGIRTVRQGNLPLDFSQQRAANHAMHLALNYAVDLASASKSTFFEFISSSFSTYIFTRPHRKLNDLELKTLSLLAQTQSCSTLFHGVVESSEGLVLAGQLARQLSEVKILSDFSDEASVKAQLRRLVMGLWNDEWALSPVTGAKSFFPDLYSSTILLKRDLSFLWTQILTGHCALNVHQFRFGFANDPSCRCGHDTESVKHFLFYCPLYDRKELIEVSLSELKVWPPSLSSIPQSPALWSCVSNFLRMTKRLRFSSVRPLEIT